MSARIVAVFAACLFAACGSEGNELDSGDQAIQDTGGKDEDVATFPDATGPGDADGPDGGVRPDRDSGVIADASVPPVETCTPVELMDVSNPQATIGDGTAASCTEAALVDALGIGGKIVFNCGSEPHTITVTTELMIARDVVIDGGDKITLSGGGTTRILGVHSSFERETPHVTVQRMRFIDGKSEGAGRDRTRGGGAMWREGGSFTIINSIFEVNNAPLIGQDVAGGAVYGVGGGRTIISGSTFTGNAGSNGGAIGSLLSELTIINTTIEGNAATGMGGNPGMGGCGGGVYMDGASEMLTLCGVRIANNTGNAAGGGLFRVSNNRMGAASIERSTIDNNRLADEMGTQGGGLFLFGLQIRMHSTTVSRNEARFAGGLFIGPSSSVDMVNSTIASNTALRQLAGGISFEPDSTGSIINCTLADNRATGMNGFGGAIRGGPMVTLKNTIVAGHEVGNIYEAISCTAALMEGNGNLQFPVAREGGGSDDPDRLCSVNAMVADAQLGELADNGGPTETLVPGERSPAFGLGTDCPATDQRGMPRGAPCTSGAVE
jgi:hypothetical protein